MTSSPGRENFSEDVRKNVARKAMYICSNPECLRVTGFSTSKGKPRAIAQAAHIVSATNRGPRGDDFVLMPDGSLVGRAHEANAAWLCMPCHYRIDADEEAFPTALLVAWKSDHEKRVSELVGLDLEQSLLRLAEVRFSHDLARELLVWLDGHRFMYFEDSREFPEDVWNAVQALRVKLIDLRGRVADSESAFSLVITRIDEAVHEFLIDLGDVRIHEIRVSSGYPEFEVFSKALTDLRVRIKDVVVPLAQKEEFSFRRILPI